MRLCVIGSLKGVTPTSGLNQMGVVVVGQVAPPGRGIAAMETCSPIKTWARSLGLEIALRKSQKDGRRLMDQTME